MSLMEKKMTKIAVPTNDGIAISEHFGRSAGFIVFTIEQNSIQSQEMRANLPHGESQHGNCAESSGDAHRQHHTGMAAILGDCQTVLCAGMGRRAADALQEAGIKAVVVPAAGPATDLVSAYLSGKLIGQDAGFCSCH